ncbi:MAG: nucleotidyltransferase domain-containing protein [Hespellia sp.]|nr:nucleotidyltransferase domain-containing protein [Hespellia sp.]
MPKVNEIIYEFSQEIKKIYGTSLKKIIMYGSYARGDYNSSSDIDIMILVNLSDEEIKKSSDQVSDVAFDFLMDYGVDISPIIKNEKHFEYWIEALPFYRNVQEEGVELIAG